MSLNDLCHGYPGRIEDPQFYCPGGFHPISIGDCFSKDRYKIIHKLGFGGSSTVWLARDRRLKRLVALKALRADQSESRNYEVAIQETLRAADPPVPHIQTVYDHFYVVGPNGRHLFLIYRFAGPSITLCCKPRQLDGTKRLRTDLAHKVIKQLVEAVDGLHRVGVAHGDITCQNILFSLRPDVHKWTDDEVYDVLGKIVAAKVQTFDGTPLLTLPPGVPAELILPAKYERLIDLSATFLEESIILADFGQSFPVNKSVHGYTPGTLINYFAPETRFEKRVGLEADVWQLGCAIFEIRAGWPLFDPMIGIEDVILRQTVEILGPLPERWRRQFEDMNSDQSEDEESPRQGGFVDVDYEEASIGEMLILIGDNDKKPRRAISPMFEKTGVKLTMGEVQLLDELLQRMLTYSPEDRIKLAEVMQHPYFLAL